MPRVTIIEECSPFPCSASGQFVTISPFYQWENIIGKAGFHVSLMKDCNKYNFGVESLSPKNFCSKDILEKNFVKSMEVVAGIRELSNYKIDKNQNVDSVQSFDINVPGSWIPKEGKFASLHFYGAVNILLALFLQREAEEYHDIECAVCWYCSLFTPTIENVKELMKHGNKYHVYDKICPEIVLFSSTEKSKLKEIRNGDLFSKVMNSVETNVTMQTLNYYPL